MRARDADTEDVVASALVEAVVAARWESAEVLSRRPSEAAADLLRGHSAELANSPFARDQLLKLALEAAAADIEKGRSPLEQGALFYLAQGTPDPEERDELRGLVAALASLPVDASERLVPEFERRQSAEGLTDEQLCARLLQEAQLQEAVWDDPRLAAEPQVRLMILRSISGFRARAVELNPSRVLALGRAERRRASAWRWRPRTPKHAQSKSRISDLAAALLRRLLGLLTAPSSRPQDRMR
jgi:hypothetical protein